MTVLCIAQYNSIKASLLKSTN